MLADAGVRQAHLLGLSWGGILAQEFYRRHAARVRSLVLAGTYAGWKGSLSAAACEERLAGCLRDAALPPDEIVPKYRPGMFGPAPGQEARAALAGVMRDFHPAGFRRMAVSSAQADTRDLLPGIRVPTLLLWGEADARSPLAAARQMQAAIPGARLEVLPGAGDVSNLEVPAEFNRAVRDFCLAVEAP